MTPPSAAPNIAALWQRLDEAALMDRGLPDPWPQATAPALCTPLAVCGMMADTSRQRITAERWADLIALANAVDLSGACRILDSGGIVNLTEQRGASHLMQRRETDWLRELMDVTQKIDPGSYDAVLHIGIGGSYLGPRLVSEAFGYQPERQTKPLFFLTSCDAPALERTLGPLRSERTLVVIASKSFSSAEMLMNARIARAWLGDDTRLFAASSHPARASESGVLHTNILPFPETVGGRFSLWSSVSLSLALTVGPWVVTDMVAGAAFMDQHVRDTAHTGDLESCLPARHALIALWNHGVCGRTGLAIVPYDRRLESVPAYAQQLIMESLGKPAARPASPIVFGGTGTEAQHSFFQMLHQGSPVVASELIGVREAPARYIECHHALLANMVAQADTLWGGHAGTRHDGRDRLPGGRPVTALWMEQMTPRTLGALIALYEHSVFMQGHIYGVNPFDQPGVEYAKQVAVPLADALKTGITDHLPPAQKNFVKSVRANKN